MLSISGMISLGKSMHLVPKRAQHATLVFRLHRAIMIMPCKPTKNIKWNREKPQQQTNRRSPTPFLRQRPWGGTFQKTTIHRMNRFKSRRRSGTWRKLVIDNRSQRRIFFTQVKLFISTRDWFVRRVRGPQIREANPVHVLAGFILSLLEK
jgi:hypothetical protein